MSRKKLSKTEQLFDWAMDCEPAELESVLMMLNAIHRRRFAQIGKSPRTISDEPWEAKPSKPRKSRKSQAELAEVAS